MISDIPEDRTRVKISEQELRAWFVHMAHSDFSEQECRDVLMELATVVPVTYLQDTFNELYWEQVESDHNSG